MTIKVAQNTNNNQFDILHSLDSPLTIKLDKSSFASIKDAKGEITISNADDANSEKITLNKIEPSSEDFTLIPEVPISIDIVDFNSQQSLIIKSTDNSKVEIKTLKVQQSANAKIENATIKEKIVLGLSSSLEINRYVKLDGSNLDLPYNLNQEQSLNDKAPINGVINTIPNSIGINSRNEGSYLADDKFLIAESTEKFDCEKWKGIIHNHANSNMNTYICSPDDGEMVLGNKVYRLYGKDNEDDKSDGGGLKPGVIAAIVIVVVVVVGVVVFVCVYFFVIKKKKNVISSEQEDNDKGADEV